MKMLTERFEKMSPEEQKKAYVSLMVQNQQMVMRMNQTETQMMLKRLDYLFKIVELGVFSEEFTEKCTKEIESIMFEKGAPEEEVKSGE